MEFQPYYMGFATADAEAIEFSLRDDRLQLTFVDWQESRIQVEFEGVSAQRWSCEAEFYPGIRDDSTYLAIRSDLVERLIECGQVSDPKAVRHFVLCFNAAGVFEVVCKSFRVIE